MIEKPFIQQFREALLRESFDDKKKREKWILAHPTWALIIVSGIILCLLAFINMAYFPPSPITSEPTMTIGGFIKWVFKLELQPVFWVALFLFLWMTKWN